MGYVVRRILHAALLAAGVSVLSFAFLELAPGSYFDELLANPQVSPETIAVLKTRYGLDQPLPVRYARWLKSAAHGEFGLSLAYNAPAGPLLLSRARSTLLLTGTATVVAWLIAIAVGLWSSGKPMWRGQVLGVTTSGLLVLPEMLVALGVLWFAVRTHWFPVGGMTSTGFDELGPWGKTRDVALHMFLPVVVLVAGMLPVLVRHVRNALGEVLDSTFVRAARGHGIPSRWILLRYALPAAANPLISLFGFSVAGLLSASMLVEVIMGWPGLGPLLLESILARDVYVVIGAVMLSSIFVVAGNLTADLLLYAADPRIRSAS